MEQIDYRAVSLQEIRKEFEKRKEEELNLLAKQRESNLQFQREVKYTNLNQFIEW